MNYPSAVPAVFLNARRENAAISKSLFPFACAILPSARAPAMIHELETLYNIAHAMFTIQVQRAQHALEMKPPRLDLFWFHSRICNTISKTLDELKVEPPASLQARPAPAPADKTPEVHPLQ